MYRFIKITFDDGHVINFDPGTWDDWMYTSGFVVIKKSSAWVAMYNTNHVFSVELVA